MLGMVSGAISESQITVSSQVDRSWVPENARLLTGRSGWAVLESQNLKNEWLQVDLGQERLVNGLIIQGGKLREHRVFMRKFRLAYSSTGSNWTLVLDNDTNKPKVSTEAALMGLILDLCLDAQLCDRLTLPAC